MRPLSERLFGILRRAFSPALPSLHENAVRARALQKAGYDIGFRFCRRLPDEPMIYTCAGTSRKEEVGLGFDFFSSDLAFTKALSETLERTLWNDPSPPWASRAFDSSYAALAHALDPRHIAGFSDAQKKADPRLECDDNTQLRWIPAVPLTKRGPRFVPLQLVGGSYSAAVAEGRIPEPMLAQSTTNGIATRKFFRDACYHGLMELIERDAFAITYFNQISPPRVDLLQIRDARVREILAQLERYRLSLEAVMLPTDMPTSIICAVIRDETKKGPAICIGAKAHAEPVEALISAIGEALIVHERSHVFNLKSRKLPPHPWGIPDRIAFWSKPENAEHLAWLTAGKMAPLPSGSQNARHLASLKHALEKKGYTASAVRLSDKKTERLGLTSVFVVSPNLQPIDLFSHPPYHGGKRLRDIPQLFGYAAAKVAPQYPHPFP